MATEIWKPIPLPEFEHTYEVSNLGRVRRAPRLCTIRIHADTGRQYVCLSSLLVKKANGGKRGLRNVSVHRIVALAFCKAQSGCPHVNHKNGKKADNKATNLEWVTQEENYEHARKNGLYKPASNRKVDPVIAVKMHNSGHSQRNIAKHFGCTKNAVATTLAHHLHGVPWKVSGVKKLKKHH